MSILPTKPIEDLVSDVRMLSAKLASEGTHPEHIINDAMDKVGSLFALRDKRLPDPELQKYNITQAELQHLITKVESVLTHFSVMPAFVESSLFKDRLRQHALARFSATPEELRAFLQEIVVTVPRYLQNSPRGETLRSETLQIIQIMDLINSFLDNTACMQMLTTHELKALQQLCNNVKSTISDLSTTDGRWLRVTHAFDGFIERIEHYIQK